MWFLTLILLILILGIIILVHEFGHFITAKKAGVHIYEFSIGMGPLLKTIKSKDGIDYNIRAFPIGGFVSMAGEVYEDDDSKKIKKEDFMCNKKWYQRVIILAAGVFNNFVLAIIVLFILALIYGAQSMEPKIGEVIPNYPVSEAGIKPGDKILEINGKKVSTWDQAQIYLVMKSDNSKYTFLIEHESGKKEKYEIAPKITKNEDGEEERAFGFKIAQEETRGFIASVKYAFQKFGSLISTMWLTVVNLFTGKIALSSLSGPVGIYQVVGQSLAAGIQQIIYLIAFLSINVGLINILPIPAFDGGRILFLIIEKIKGSPVNQKFENMCHTVFFFLLIALMIYITVFDIIRF
ncbi:MAG: site-2 protease family protein [Bacilli bacterium]|jgi:regulator of sigma E protease|nr:site-2 protease family protein [Bacilli bacterium]MCX4254150.1 M50 family metallopeptidase [Bacilli bacterium]